MKRVGSVLADVVVVGGVLLLLLLAPDPALAQQDIAPLPTPSALIDFSCRGCHGDKTDALILPSGEALPLGVDLTALDASPHSARNDPSIPCTACHINETQYRYPHAENAAVNLPAYHSAVSQSCEGCHYPHIPFHENVDPAQHTLPTCVNCHGSHDIARVAEMALVMPDRCVECHTDRSRDWVADFLEPRPGIGGGAEGFAGSMRCAGCHEDIYFSWRKTLHANIIQNPATAPAAVVADFNSDDPDLTFELSEVRYTVGGRWKQQFLTEIEGSEHLAILPAQWNVATQEWVAYHPDAWQDSDWRKECAGCHVTGLDAENWTFKEFGVGCESCHGPGVAHASDPENVKPFTTVDDQVCGACHSRGKSPQGHPFPVTYRPGDVLTEHLTFTTDEAHIWPDGSAKKNYQQYMDWNLGNTMQQAPGMSCITCHVVHDSSVGPGQLRDEPNALCISCHAPQAALVRHTPYHEVAMSRREFQCVDCHMPLMATSAVEYDIHNHSLFQPNPESSVEYGGLDVMPNACNNCHTGAADTPERAAETIVFARLQAPPVAGGFFGPGPTPTSPPPPTPMAAVGQPPVVVDAIEPRTWAQWGLFAMGGAVAFVAIAWGTYRIRLRRERHA